VECRLLGESRHVRIVPTNFSTFDLTRQIQVHQTKQTTESLMGVVSVTPPFEMTASNLKSSLLGQQQ
jgi:hypothetical protein